MARESLNSGRSDTRHACQFFERTKRPLGRAVLDDSRGKSRTDSRQPQQFLRAGTIDIDPLVGTERTGEALGTTAHRVDIGPVFNAGPVTDRTGCHRSLTEIAYSDPSQSHAQQDSRSATIVR